IRRRFFAPDRFRFRCYLHQFSAVCPGLPVLARVFTGLIPSITPPAARRCHQPAARSRGLSKSNLDGRRSVGLILCPVEQLIIDIVLCIIAAWVMAIACQVIKQPLIMAYLVAGFAIGPHGFKWVTDAHSIETISSIGLILLLFMIGLEMDLKKMFS